MKEIKVHQALHGYSDGHTLLQSSIRISLESERIMLTMSDMSGSSMVAGFETYLSGYPLPVEQLYVFAKTWYASEMDRPGCVWTHSLILGQAELEQVKDGSELLALFKRPSKLLHDYSRPINFELPPESSLQRVNISERLASALVWALYVVPDKPVYLLASTSSIYDALVVRVWSQQWPGLKKTFGFCTGSIADRKVSGRSLDLQVVPDATYPQTRNDLARGTIIDRDKYPVNSTDVPRWLNGAALDLLSEQSHIRSYARQLSAAIPSSRGAFRHIFWLAALVDELKSSNLSVSDFVDEITGAVRSKDLPTELLKAVLGPPDSLLVELEAPEWDILRSLASSADDRVLETSELRIRDRASALWQRERSAALQLFREIVESQITRMGEEILSGMCEAMDLQDIHDVLEVAQGKTGMLNVIVRQRPRLALSPAMWRLTPGVRNEIFHSLMAADLSEHDLEKLARILLTIHDETVPDIALGYGDRLIRPLLNAVNRQEEGSDYRLDYGWMRYFRHHSRSILHWATGMEGHLTPLGAALLASVLSPESKEVLSTDLNLWLRMSGLVPSLPNDTQVIVAGFLLATAFRTCDLRATELIVTSFEITHDMAACDQLPYETWRSIEQVAPPLSMWRGWDKCERIRLALIDRFIACTWPPSDLLRAVTNPDTLKKVLDSSTTSKQRRRFLRQLVDDGRHGHIETTPAQRKVLDEF